MYFPSTILPSLLLLLSSTTSAYPTRSQLSRRQNFEWVEHTPTAWGDNMEGLNDDAMAELAFEMYTWFENLEVELENGEIQAPDENMAINIEEDLDLGAQDFQNVGRNWRVEVMFYGEDAENDEDSFRPPNLEFPNGDTVYQALSDMMERRQSAGAFIGQGPDDSRWICEYRVVELEVSDQDSGSVANLAGLEDEAESSHNSWSSQAIGILKNLAAKDFHGGELR